MKVPAKKKRKPQQLVWPAIVTRKRPRPYFPPLDLEKLISEATKQGLAGVQLERWTVEKLRERTREHASELLSTLEIDPEDPNLWKKAFFVLAQAHHGLGRVSYGRKRAGAKVRWRPGDLVLLQQVLSLKAKGLNERAAIREIASRRDLQVKLEYKGYGMAVKGDPRRQREDALRQRLQRILRRVRQNPDALEQQLLGSSEDPTVGILLSLQQKPW